MTSSPAPDLDELERYWPVGDDLAVMEAIPALLQEVRAARAAVAESGRLTALDLAVAMNTAQIRCDEIRLGHDLLVPATRILRALLATPPAPSDHGAGDDELVTAVDRALLFVLQLGNREHVQIAALGPAAFLRALAQDGFMVSRSLAAPSVPPEPASPEPT